MEPLSEPHNTVWPFPFTAQDWAQTPLAVQAYVHTLRNEVAQLHDRVEILEARLTQNSTTSSRPPSSDSPYKKPRLRPTAATPRKVGGKPGHPGHRRVLLPPRRLCKDYLNVGPQLGLVIFDHHDVLTAYFYNGLGQVFLCQQRIRGDNTVRQHQLVQVT